MTSPTQRSLKALRADGWHCEIVEHWNHFTRRRHDLFGFADLLCIKKGHKPLLVQVTSTGVSSRVHKVEQSPNLELVALHFDIEVHGWRKSTKNGRYVQRVVPIT